MKTPLDRALGFLLSDEPEAALRWSAAALEREPSSPGALFVTARALLKMGRTRAAVEGLWLAAQRAAGEGEAALAIAAIRDLRAMGVDAREVIDEVAGAICRGSNVEAGVTEEDWPRFVDQGELRPLGPAFRGRALASKATQMIYEAAGVDREPPSPIPLFGLLSREAARDFIIGLEAITVPENHRVIAEGEEIDAAYVVACGGVEIERPTSTRERKSSSRVPSMASLGSGALFGELALLARMPAPSSVVTTRPSILLVARRDAIERIGARYPDLRLELGAHCRRQAIANLGWASPVMAAVPSQERAALVERMELRIFEQGERLGSFDEEADGLHVIVSGEVALVARDGAERVVLSTLGVGDTVGEVALVLCHKADTEAVALRSTATLLLPRADFFALVQDYPSILHGLYSVAVRLHADTRRAIEAGTAAVGDDCLFEEEKVRQTEIPRPALEPVHEDDATETPLPLASKRSPTVLPTPAPSPPVARAAPVRSVAADRVGPPAAPSARASSPPSSLAPTVSTSAPPRASSPARSSLARVSAQGAAVAAVAASVVVFAHYESRREDTRESQPTPAAEPTPAPVVTSIEAVNAPPQGPRAALAVSAPAQSPPSPPGLPVAPPPNPTKAFLTSALTKRRPPPVLRTAQAATATATAPSAVPSAPTASALPAPQPERSDAENEFGGRE